MEKKINGYSYTKQYADKYYLVRTYCNPDSTDLEIYDATQNQLKVLKLSNKNTIRINKKIISVNDFIKE